MENCDKIVHEKFKTYGKNAKEWMRKCVLLLPEIEKRRIWRKKGFTCIYEYAAKLTGMSRNTVDDALRILRKIEDKPELLKVVEEKGINSVRPIVAIATKENASFWAEKAENMSVNTLRTYRRELLDISRNVPESPSEKVTVSMELDPKIAEEFQKLKGNKNWEDFIKEIIEAEKAKIEKPEPVKSDSRHIPTKIKKFILKRSNRICEFPNCEKQYKIFHHTKRFALQKTHDHEKIAALCEEHERIAHLGLIENEEMRPKFWKIRSCPDKIDIKYAVDRTVTEHRTFRT